jgi:heme exporter protein B
LRVVLAILWKDLVIEWRRRDRVAAMLLFSLLVVMVFHFAFPDAPGQDPAARAPGLLWVTYVFAALLGLNRGLSLELENDALSGLALAPGERGWIFLGKAAANFVLIGAVQAVLAAVFAMVFDVELGGAAGRLAVVISLALVGLCAVGTLCATMAVRTRFSEVLLPILLLPALFPVLSGAVRGTSAALVEGRLAPDALQLLVVIDGIYLIVSFLGFEYLLDE